MIHYFEKLDEAGSKPAIVGDIDHRLREIADLESKIEDLRVGVKTLEIEARRHLAEDWSKKELDRAFEAWKPAWWDDTPVDLEEWGVEP